MTMAARIVILLILIFFLADTLSEEYKPGDFKCYPLGGYNGFIYEANLTAGIPHDPRSKNTGPELPPIPPFVYLKTHKTGSTSMANILHRMIDIRNKTVMVSLLDNYKSQLGWPNNFPGDFAERRYEKHYVDAIVDHSVYSRSKMLQYMKGDMQKAIFFTTLREPFEQAVSSYKYFAHQNPSMKEYYRNIAHEEMNTIPGDPFPSKIALAKNSQAYDLGWYKKHNWSFDYDHNPDEIQNFLAKLEREINLFICLDKMDEGLILLSHLLGVEVNELVGVDIRNSFAVQRSNHSSTHFERFRERIERLYNIDKAIYDRFCGAAFNRVWKRYSAEVKEARLRGSTQQTLESRLKRLQIMNSKAAADCSVERNRGTAKCHLAMTVSETPYSGYFIDKQDGKLPPCPLL